jgi:hypothetical protein
VFEYKVDGATLSYHWTNVLPGFDMPLRVALGGGGYSRITPTESWQTVQLPAPGAAVRVDENFYVEAKNLSAPAKP